MNQHLPKAFWEVKDKLGYHVPGMFRHFPFLFLMCCYLGNKGQRFLAIKDLRLHNYTVLQNVKTLWMSSHRKGGVCSNEQGEATWATWASSSLPDSNSSAAVSCAAGMSPSNVPWSSQVLLCIAKVYSENYNSRKALQEKKKLRESSGDKWPNFGTWPDPLLTG